MNDWNLDPEVGGSVLGMTNALCLHCWNISICNLCGDQ